MASEESAQTRFQSLRGNLVDLKTRIGTATTDEEFENIRRDFETSVKNFFDLVPDKDREFVKGVFDNEKRSYNNFQRLLRLQNKLVESIQTLRGKIDGIRSEAAQAKAERDALQTKMKLAEGMKGIQEGENALLQNQIDELNAKIAAATEQNDRFREIVDKLREELRAAIEAERAASQQAANLRAQLDDALRDSATKDENIAKAQEELRGVRAELNAQIGALQTASDEAKRRAEEQINKLRAEKSDLEATIATLEAENGSLRALGERLQNELAQALEALKKAAGDAADLRADLETANGDIVTANAEIEALKTAVAEAEGDKARVTLESAAKDETIAQLKRRNRELEQELAEAGTELREFLARIAEEEKDLNQVRALVNNYLGVAADLESKIVDNYEVSAPLESSRGRPPTVSRAQPTPPAPREGSPGTLSQEAITEAEQTLAGSQSVARGRGLRPPTQRPRTRNPPPPAGPPPLSGGMLKGGKTIRSVFY